MKNGIDRDVALADHVLERNRERVAELGVLGVGHVEVVVDDQLVEDVLGHLAMDRQVVLASGELGDGAVAGDDGERRDAGHRERLDVIGAEEQDRRPAWSRRAPCRARFIAAAGLIELLRILVRRPREHVRRVARADCCNDFTHCCLLVSDRILIRTGLGTVRRPSRSPSTTVHRLVDLVQQRHRRHARWRRSTPARALRGWRRRTRCPGGRRPASSSSGTSLPSLSVIESR